MKKIIVTLVFSMLTANIFCQNFTTPVTITTGTFPTLTLTSSSASPTIKLVNMNSYQWELANHASANGFYIYDRTAGAYRLFITSGGNVGIGTTTPGTKLDVNGSLNVSGEIKFSSNTISCSSFSCGQIVNLNLNGCGGLHTMATFHYGDGIFFNAAAYSLKTSDIERLTITNSGNVGIGCSAPSVKLAVSGKIHATEIEIKSAPCSDFVFEKDYKLMSLSELEMFVSLNKHLPEVPSAKEFAEKGYSIHQMDDLLLRKVEELTLYLIELKKENEQLKQAFTNFLTNNK